MKVTFAEQAERFLKEGASRKRNPLRPASVRTYQTAINILTPLIGKMPLQDIGNKVLNETVTKLSEQGYSPRSIALNVMLIKKVRKSAISEDGDVLFPYAWSSDVIDAPSTGNEKQPTIDAAGVASAISKADTHRKAMYAVLAGTGLRIAEALATVVGPDDGVSTVWLSQESKVVVRQQRTRAGLATTKTRAGQRDVDLDPELNERLMKIFSDPGLMFPNHEGYYREWLEKDGIQGGFHSFRRFRVTHLRMSGVPDPLVKYWIGHSSNSVTEQYTQVAGEIESRKQYAAKVGLGFQLSEVQ